jgi:hypothetical protein
MVNFVTDPPFIDIVVRLQVHIVVLLRHEIFILEMRVQVNFYLAQT